MRLKTSLAGRLAAALAGFGALAAGISAYAAEWFASPLRGALSALLLVLPLGLWIAARLVRPWVRSLHAVRDGVVSLRDHDFSVSVGHDARDELGELVEAYNSLGDLLRRERLELFQRELLLDTVIQATPLALVLTNASGRVVYSNVAARQLFQGGRRLEGLEFRAVLTEQPQPLRDALAAEGDALFTAEMAGEPQVFHLSQRRFLLNAQSHRLVLLKQLTRELAAQEVATWKKVIRVIAHELNNSLAPISSLAHSGRLLAYEPDAAQLTRVFSTIEERANHLASFIDGYARFAKLPKPRITPVAWDRLVVRLEGATPFRLAAPPPKRAAAVDASQLEQVLINVLKNAAESGSPPEAIELEISEARGGFLIEVRDRGSGLAGEALQNALLPFFSTKASGTGLGLTLCREIVEAHDGRLSVANRPDGGAVVTIWLPGGGAEAVRSRA
jgi:two-component system, NtrC family, nitrogen regulation sensor histidine kinase NtrY